MCSFCSLSNPILLRTTCTPCMQAPPQDGDRPIPALDTCALIDPPGRGPFDQQDVFRVVHNSLYRQQQPPAPGDVDLEAPSDADDVSCTSNRLGSFSIPLNTFPFAPQDAEVSDTSSEPSDHDAADADESLSEQDRAPSPEPDDADEPEPAEQPPAPQPQVRTVSPPCRLWSSSQPLSRCSSALTAMPTRSTSSLSHPRS